LKSAGACGAQRAAAAEAELARTLNYDAVLLRMDSDLALSDKQHLDRVRVIASILPVVGFYLQPAAGGRLFSYRYWRELAEIENVVAIKIAPFNRYQTIDVVRAVADA
jgi:dihydrodipicolinate synthase/N-acetylneuraminate lyase